MLFGTFSRFLLVNHRRFWIWGFERKTPSSSAGNCSPFEWQHLACYSPLVETGYLTLSLQVTKQPELLIMNWVISDPPSHKVGWAQQESIVKWNCFIRDQAQTCPKGTNKLHDEVAQMSMASTPIAIPSAVKHASIASWGEPYDCWPGKRRQGPGMLMVLHIMQAPPKSGQLQNYNSFLKKPRKTPANGNFHSGQIFRQFIWSHIFFRRMKWSDVILFTNPWTVSMDWMDSQELGKAMIGKIGEKCV